MIRRGLAAVALAALAGCTAIKLTYNNLDWIAQWQLGRFVDLDPPQKALFDQRFHEFWAWHRGTQLKLYVADLRELAGKVDRPLTVAQVDDYLTRSTEHLSRAMREAVPDTARVLQTFDDQQIAELTDNLAKRREEKRKESADLSAEGVRDQAEDQMTRNLKRWVGSLTPAEKARVHRWAQERRYEGTIWYQYQEAWAQAFAEVLRHRREPDFEQRLGSLFREAKLPYGEEMARLQAYNRQKWIELLADISAELTDDQRSHLRDKILELAGQLEDLAAQAQRPPAK